MAALELLSHRNRGKKKKRLLSCGKIISQGEEVPFSGSAIIDFPIFPLLYCLLLRHAIALFTSLNLCSRCPRTNHHSRRPVPLNSEEIFTLFALRLPGFIASWLVALKNFATKQRTYSTSIQVSSFRTKMFSVLLRIYIIH